MSADVKATNNSRPSSPIRMWPGLILGILLLVIRFGIPKLVPGFEGFQIGMMGGALGSIVLILWWLIFSRASIIEKWGGFALLIMALIVTWFLKHQSMELLWLVGFGIPVACLALVAWAVVFRNLSGKIRFITLSVCIIFACGIWTLFRTYGIDGDHVSDFAWRWEASPEEVLLSEGDMTRSTSTGIDELGETLPQWPGFRGPNRDGIVRSIQIMTDWETSPPTEIWRKPIGPAWSSFAVHGDLVFTQEQRGEEEAVSCYHIDTGEMVWIHRDKARFFESNGGAGPRGTPTLAHGCVFTLGGTGIFNVLDASDGSLLWSRNAAEDALTQIPIWGFSGSPLVVDSLVVVPLSGSLVAYEIGTGNVQWTKPMGGDCYSSPHLLRTDEEIQILFLTETGMISVHPENGSLNWEHPWKGVPIVQPTIGEKGDILISVDEKSGIRRISKPKGPDDIKSEERWTSARLKPYFNDSVIHKNNVYGFDGPFLACIDLETGDRKWRGRRRYGRGQFILLEDQDLMIVLSEKGEIAMVKAVPEKFDELASLPAIQGKTWNHPVLADDILLVRNAQEMVAFKLKLINETRP